MAYDDTKEGVLIDCGCSTESEWLTIKRFLESEEIKIKHLLNTHLHFDHVWGNASAARDLGINPEASKLDINLYNNIENMVHGMFGVRIPIPAMPPIATDLREGSVIAFGNTKLTVLATPGHSQGSLCFYCEEEGILFSGDTLFCGSMGRTDLEGGNMSSMIKSLRRLSELPDETEVHCGHGDDTTIDDEKKYNPYF